jgi:hypothetical protein
MRRLEAAAPASGSDGGGRNWGPAFVIAELKCYIRSGPLRTDDSYFFFSKIFA